MKRLPPSQTTIPYMLRNCAVRQYTADGTPVGRCFYYLDDGHTCPRHGDVARVQAHYEATGKLVDDFDLEAWR